MRRLIYLLFLFFLGCTSDVDLDVVPLSPQIVIHSVNEVGKKFEVKVMKSQSIYENIPPDANYALANATVTIYKNDILAERLAFSDSSFSYLAENTVVETGVTYRIEVSAANFASVSAQSTAPERVPITLQRYTPNARVRDNDYSYDEAIITFQDPPEKNYYNIRLYVMPQYYANCIFCNDPDIEKLTEFDNLFEAERCYGPNYLILSDAGFNNRQKTLSLFIESYYTEPDYYQPTILADNISKEYFDFLTSSILNQSTSDNPFAEPVNVIGNVENGFGIFTIITSNRLRLIR